MKYKIMLLFVFVISFQMSWAQKRNITGKVLDENRQPMPSTNIVIEGTTRGVITDMDGNFSIEVNDDEKLQFIFIGYKTLTVPVKGRTNIKIVMEPKVSTLDDVVVIGYGTQKRENMVGAISDVSGNTLRKSGLTNISHMIQDQLPGVMTEIQSGQPGADDAKITIRGISTFGDNNSPLILIDGIVAAGGFSQLDPGEIASITVLKDASSTAIYGVLGANGVILITTRRGNKGAPRVTVASELTAKTMFDRPDQLGSYDVLMLGQEAIKNSGFYNGLRSQRYINGFLDPNRDQILYPDIDWYDELVKDVGFETQNRVNVTGGTDFVKYFAQISSNYQGDIIKSDNSDGYYDPEFNFNKINFRTNLDFNISSTTILKTDISGRTEIRRTPNTEVNPSEFSNVFKFIDEATPYLFPKYYPADFMERYPDPYDPNAGMRLSSAMREQPYQGNPYNELYWSGMRKYRTDVLDFQVGLEQDLKFITKGLKVSGRINYSTMFKYRKTESRDRAEWLYFPERDSWSIERAGQNYNSTPLDFHSSGGESYQTNSRNIYYEFKMAYNRTFGANTFDFTGVFSRRERSGNVGVFPDYHEDWVGRLVYDYGNKYMAEISAGYNGSEKFAKGKRFGFFPAAAIGWNIAREDFVKDNIPWLNKAKIRFSYGKTGSEAGARFMYEGGWKAVSSRLGYNRFGFPAASEVSRYAETKIANPNATWETAYKKNLGFDFALFNNELSIQVDIYDERREDIFISQPVGSFYHPSFGSGLSNHGGKIGLPVVNLGETKNNGAEIVCKYSHITPFGLTYFVGGNMNFADNRIVFKADKPFAPDYQKQAGKPISFNLGYQTNGYINTFEEAVNAPKINGGAEPGDYFYADFSGNGEIEVNDRIPMNTSQPSITYGFNFGGNYKDFDLRIRFFGKDDVWYTTSKLYPTMDEFLLSAKDIHLDRWSPENTNAEFPAFTNAGTAFYKQGNDQNIVDASFLKLQSVTLGYTIKSAYLKELLRIQSLQLNLSGQNLASWSNVPYGDPEAANGVGSGYGNYPLVRRFILGVNVNF